MKRTHAALISASFALLIGGCAGCEDTAGEEAPAADTPRVAAPDRPDGNAPVDERNMADADSDVPPAVLQAVLVVQYGDDLNPAVRERIDAHLRGAAVRPIVENRAVVTDTLPPGSLVLGFGDVPATDLVLGPDRAAPGPEGYLLKSVAVGEVTVIAVDGTSGPDDDGVRFGAYALLEQLGFGFLHPLEPTVPATLPAAAPPVDIATAPRWWFRGLQLHTMHPLELAELLNGWGPGGPDDDAGWRAMLPEWDRFLEWMLANGQNRVHWSLLSAEPWANFAGSPKHMERLRTLVLRAHEFGVRVGADTPIRQHQQHTWRMIDANGTLEEQTAQIRDRIDLLMGAEFDYVATSSGTTEFTSPGDERMLAWMDALTLKMSEAGKPAYIKVHASTGQTTPNYDDRDTGEPLNFNFLPTYADPRLGVMPHTVQHYALDDPAPTYGNTDFGYIREFLQEEVGRRPTVWHPETAYWVSFDIDVPLFLPVYAFTRVRDLRLLAGDEDQGRMGRGVHAGGSMDGQSTFSSGWEWGYWLGEVVTARAAWNPRTELGSDSEATRALLQPLERVCGDAGPELVNLVVEYAMAQHELLIHGIVNGTPPQRIERRNGQAYLQGSETWDDVANIGAQWLGMEESRTQPAKLQLSDLRRSSGRRTYTDEVEPLLDAMQRRFADLDARLAALRPRIPTHALPVFEDIADAAHMTALRARQVHGLYDYVDLRERGGQDAAAQLRLQDARAALDEALTVVAAREANYRVPADRIAGWRPNPTAYEFTYLWTVRSLFYWWRDEGKAVLAPASPCYLNIINPLTVAFGEGTYSRMGEVASDIFTFVPGLGSSADCAGAPDREPTYPPAGVR